MTTYRGRITHPVPYESGSGRKHNNPAGPCLVENERGRSMDVFWGAHGERCVALPLEDIEAAQAQGHLVMVD